MNTLRVECCSLRSRSQAFGLRPSACRRWASRLQINFGLFTGMLLLHIIEIQFSYMILDTYNGKARHAPVTINTKCNDLLRNTYGKLNFYWEVKWSGKSRWYQLVAFWTAVSYSTLWFFFSGWLDFSWTFLELFLDFSWTFLGLFLNFSWTFLELFWNFFWAFSERSLNYTNTFPQLWDLLVLTKPC